MGQYDGAAHPQDVDYATYGELATPRSDRRTLWDAIESDAVRSLQCLIDALPDPVVIKDSGHRWVAVNAAVCALASRSREEIIGRTSFDFFPEEQARAQWAADDEVLARGGVVDWSATLRSPTGREHQVRSRNRRLTLGTPPNDATFLLSVVEDVTQALEAELKLRESEENYRYTLELSPQIPWTAGPDGQILEIGPRWETQVGTSLQEASAGGWLDALAPADSELPEQLLRAADTALYRAKGEGGGTYRLFEPEMHERLQERQAMKIAMHGALGRGEFEVHYQPLINLQSGKISCFEALVRWRHPERGLIAPDQFIPVAEENDFITSIGAWVLNQACEAAVDWPSDIDVAVNLSPLQFRGQGLVGTVTEACAKAGLDPRRLQLEITESVILHDSSANLAILTELRRLGVRIALDDFGTGYSSLSYLRHFPVDKLKLDRSFVGDLPAGMGARAIVRAVAGLAAGLGLTMTAEGIETADQVEALLEEGYTEGQGYYFSLPVPAENVLEVIAANAIAANKSSIIH